MNIKLTISLRYVLFQVCLPLCFCSCIHNKWTSLCSTVNGMCTYNKHVGILCNMRCIINGIMWDTLIEEKVTVSKLDSQCLRSTMCLLKFYIVTFYNYLCNTVKNLPTSSFGCIKSYCSSLKQWRRSIILNQRNEIMIHHKVTLVVTRLNIVACDWTFGNLVEIRCLNAQLCWSAFASMAMLKFQPQTLIFIPRTLKLEFDSCISLILYDTHKTKQQSKTMHRVFFWKKGYARFMCKH